MAVAVTDANLKKLKTNNDNLKTQLAKWPTILSNLEKSLTDNTGKTFKDNYAKGKDACDKIQQIVKIFQDEKKEMDKVVLKVEEFIAAQQKANTKK